MKKLGTVLLTATMVCSLSVGAFANTLEPTYKNKIQMQLLNKSNANDANCLLNNNNNFTNMDIADLCEELGIKDFYTQYEDCFTGIVIPDVNKPSIDKPNTDKPNTDKPETDKPNTEKPEIDKPNTDKPEIDKPELPPVSGGEETNESKFAAEVVRLVNVERKNAGLQELKVQSQVQSAAQVRAKETEKSFSHTRPDGTSCFTALKESGAKYTGAGENIAMGQKTPEMVMKSWMNSEGHRANILSNKFTTIGVGYYVNDSGTQYWTQMFTY